jgi:hypothetical protein
MRHVILLSLLIYGSLCLTQELEPAETDEPGPPPGYREAYVQDITIMQSSSVVHLQGRGTDLSLRMHVSRSQGESIYLALHNITLSRPLTHDLLMSFLEESGMRLRYLRIDRLEDGIYYATLVVSGRNMEISVDTRPSDGIVLALKADAPIYVKMDLLRAGEGGREEHPIIEA